MKQYLTGKYRPKKPEKYVGDINNIIYRSGWELRFLNYLDKNPNVINYASEEVSIPYLSPVDGRLHRYFPDFIIKVRKPDGTIQNQMIEIKPYKQTQPPVLTENKKKKQFKYEVDRYGINLAKWKAAQEFCAERKWEFIIITEKHLNLG